MCHYANSILLVQEILGIHKGMHLCLLLLLFNLKRFFFFFFFFWGGGGGGGGLASPEGALSRSESG